MGASFLAAFWDHPNIRFAQQEADEEIELLLRAHWITNAPWLVVSLVTLLLPVFLNIKIINLPQELLAAAVILWYLLILAFMVEKFLIWYFNIYIVTTKHLVDINFHNLLFYDVTEVQVEDIQSISHSVKGIIHSLFNFGNVFVETAAKQQRVEFVNVPRSAEVADRIQDLKEKQEVGHVS